MAVDAPEIRTFSGTDTQGWLRWKKHVTLSSKGFELAGWNAEDIKIEILRSLDGPAADMLAETPWGGADITPQLFLNHLEARLLPASASDQAVSDYENAVQAGDQSLQAYHVHLEMLYRRAFPDLQNWKNSRDLITKFTSTLRSHALKKALVAAQINNYTDAREVAILAETRLARLNRRNPTASIDTLVPPEMATALANAEVNLTDPEVAKAINFMENWYSARGRGMKANTPWQEGSCYACCSQSHYIRDCSHREIYNRGKRAGEKRSAAGRGGQRHDSKRTKKVQSEKEDLVRIQQNMAQVISTLQEENETLKQKVKDPAYNLMIPTKTELEIKTEPLDFVALAHPRMASQGEVIPRRGSERRKKLNK